MRLTFPPWLTPDWSGLISSTREPGFDGGRLLNGDWGGFRVFRDWGRSGVFGNTILTGSFFDGDEFGDLQNLRGWRFGEIGISRRFPERWHNGFRFLIGLRRWLGFRDFHSLWRRGRKVLGAGGLGLVQRRWGLSW